MWEKGEGGGERKEGRGMKVWEEGKGGVVKGGG